MTWTPEKIAILRQHWGRYSTREIGDMVCKSRNAVIGKADRLHLKRLVISPKMRAATLRGTHAATTARAIALHDRMVRAA